MNPFADAFANFPIAEDSAFPLSDDVAHAASLSNGAAVVAQSVTDPRPAGVTTTGNAGASADIPVTDAEDEAMKERAEVLAAAPSVLEDALKVREIMLSAPPPRFEEWHVTVKGDPVAWADFCRENGIKPLFIELQGGATQLMCASAYDPSSLIHQLMDDNERQLFTVVRVKHEVSALRDGEKAVYYEAHAKLNGPWRTDRKGVSRDLYRVQEQRWYMTYRSSTPFDAAAFALRAKSLSKPSLLAEVEYEACILDTNPALDGGWL